MTASRPLVSVVITTYYRNEWLRRAIEHVLDQTYDPVEVVVVDDSGDRHAEPVVDDYDVGYVAHGENRGAIAARNTGFEAVDGEYVQFHDDDDLLRERKVERQVELLEANDRVGVVYCGIEHDDGSVVLPDPDWRGDLSTEALALYDLYPCQTSSMLVRASLLESVLPMRRYGGGFDYALALELSQATRFDFVAEPLVRRGSAERSKGGSIETMRAHLAIVRDHAPLYADHPELERAVLAEAYANLGHVRLDRHRWSPAAVGALLKANALAPTPNARYLALLLLSPFGRPGLEVGRRIRAGLRWASYLRSD